MSLRLGTQEIAPIIEVGGGSATGIPRIDMTATTATLDPNKFYVWGEVASLDISLAAETAGIQNVYKFQFQSGGTATTLTLPNNIVWSGGFLPSTILTTYIISIESNIAKIERSHTKGLVPPEYQQVEFLQGNGTGAYIATGWYTTSTGCAKVKFKFYNTGDQIVTGAEPTADARFGIGYWRSIYIGMGDQANFTGEQINLTATYFTTQDLLNKQWGLFEGQLNSITCTFNEANSVEYYLFRVNGNTSTTTAKIYECLLYTSGNLMRHFYPCYRIADSEPGMFDIVNGVFYTNAGAGSFIVGPDV